MKPFHFALHCCAVAASFILLSGCSSKTQVSIPFQEGELVVKAMADNAVRVLYIENPAAEMPEWLYVDSDCAPRMRIQESDSVTTLTLPSMTLKVNTFAQTVTAFDKDNNRIFHATSHSLKQGELQGKSVYGAELEIESPTDEYLYGLGQFQDGYSNVRGLTRRLTQVNTQISIPFFLSSKGYGVLWNNYGMTDFNPADQHIALTRGLTGGEKTTVNVTSTEGGKNEVRQEYAFMGQLDIPEDGKYAILLDVGQNMARKHHLDIDNVNYVDVKNIWLPPTTSLIVDMKAGRHEIVSKLEEYDSPVLYFRKIDNNTVLRSPVAQAVDYTLFAGEPDEIIASYRNLTGEVPMIPQWALGYTHCRERYNTQDELLENAATFRERNLPIDLIVQDWLYWGKYGWNAMQFDEERYPNPAQMVKELHDMNMHLMLSVWSKVDENSILGRQMKEKGYYIPGTTWVDFFNENAANFYWRNFSDSLLQYGIDAWWQDATEPENDDLVGRLVNNGTVPGELYRNVYPLLVSKTVYEGLRRDDPERRSFIFTRSAFSGIQRYGSAVWSGDVGNDWETLRRQIVGGLGFVSTGIPWWTYDAGGFFRPSDQYTDNDYIECMIRWIQTATFMPLMRVHGYMSNTEPWRYGKDTERIIEKQLNLRYRLLPYIYSAAADVSFNGSTMMRPLIFDFRNDEEALKQSVEFMFGKSLLVNPVVEANISSCRTYLPENNAGWYDFYTGDFYKGGRYVDLPVNIETIPVFVKGGTILPIGPVRQFAAEVSDKPMEIHIYPGADASFRLYEDNGTNYDYEKGKYAEICFKWDDANGTLTISDRKGSFENMMKNRTFTVCKGNEKQAIEYNGAEAVLKFAK